MSQVQSNISRSPFSSNDESTNYDLGILLNLLPSAAILIDTEGLIIAANNKFYNVSNYSDPDLLGKYLGDIFNKTNLEEILYWQGNNLLLNCFRKESLPVRIKPIKLFGANPKHIVIITLEDRFEDIDEIEKKLLTGLESLISLFNESEIQPIFDKVIDITSKLLDTNNICIYQVESGYPRLTKVAACIDDDVFPSSISITELIRLNDTTIWCPGKRVFSEIHRAGKRSNFAYVATTPLGNDAAKIGFLVVGDNEKQPIDKINSILSILGTFISTALQHNILINNLREENHLIQENIHFYNQIVESSPDGIIVLSPSMIILEINPAAEIMLGYSGWEIKGKEVENILVGPQGLWKALQDAINSVPTHDLGNVNLHRRNGQSFTAMVQIIPILTHKVLSKIIIFIRDISEHEQNRIRTQQLEHRALLGVFTAVFAHEVRNPINNISTGLQLLSTKLGTDGTNQDIVNRIQADCTRLNQLMESVLAYSRPMETKFEQVHLSNLLNKILDRWHPRLVRLGVELFFTSEDNLPPVLGDVRSLEQVFTNLISNAVDAMGETGGTLGVRIQRVAKNTRRTWIEIAISDNGHGIPDELKDHIFEPFVSTSPRGTGLGLAITKSIITAHRGSINLSSFPGGTVFQIHLLAAEGD
jgi:two-component system, NtrC family, sensor histidine kinase AtoS